MSAIDKLEQKAVHLYLKQTGEQKKKITGALQQSLVGGDIVPRMVSSVVWQTCYDVARTWIDTVTPSEFQQFSKHIGRENYDNLIDSNVRLLISEVGLFVLKILLQPPTLSQRLSSRLGLLTIEAKTLSIPEQDRIIANSLQMPYRTWISIMKAMVVHEKLYDFMKDANTSMRTLGQNLIIENSQPKQENFPVIVPNIPGGILHHEGNGVWVKRKANRIEVDFSGGIHNSISFDATILSHFREYITTPEQEQKVRNMIFGESGITVWKNRFGGKGKGKNDTSIPEQDFVWQK